MICPMCGGEIYTDWPCFKCGTTYDEIISSISHPNMKRLMEKEHLDENEETELAEEIRNASFLVPATFIDGQFHVMTVEDRSGNIFIPIFTDRTEYDNAIDDITPLTNPFDIVLDLLDERVEGFAVNIAGKDFEMNSKFLDKHFGGR